MSQNKKTDIREEFAEDIEQKEKESEEQTNENSTLDSFSTQSKKASNTSRLISNTLLISIIFYIINICFNYFRYGGYGWFLLYPLNIISLSNPITLVQMILDYRLVASHWDIFNFGYALENFGAATYFTKIILFILGPFINFYIATKFFNNKTIDKDSSSIGLNIGKLLKNSISLSYDNTALILGSSILWILTGWIPYINVGTTIGLLSIIVSIGNGSKTSATEIFKAEHRKRMGEYFLLIAFLIIGISLGYSFLIIPGVVLTLAWSQSILLFIDKGYSPLKSIEISNDITYGNKITIFSAFLIAVVLTGLLLGFIISLAFNTNEPVLFLVVTIISYLIFIVITFGFVASLYGELSKELKK